MSKILKIMKKIKIKNLVILIILLLFNTYAWFLFNTKVSTGMEMHVSSWKVEFSTQDGVLSQDVIIKIDKIFPGMITENKKIIAETIGETEAILEYEINSITIMGETFSKEQGLTSQQLEEKLKLEYPFKTNVLVENFGQIPDNPKQGIININVEWPFESGNDELDTQWGNKAFDFQETNPEANSIEIKLTLIARQKN